MLRVFKIFLLSVIFAYGFNAAAQTGDADAGKDKSGTCVACHGTDGNSPLDQFPKIAGQVSGYIAKQLANFKSGQRENSIMLGMTASLSEKDMADLDTFYSGQSITGGSVSDDQEAAARAGEEIFRGGITEFSVPACMGCHGPSGSGIPPNFPRLAGQHAAYIEAQLLAFKSGTRTNDIMQPIAFPLSEEQIKQLALYISGLN